MDVPPEWSMIGPFPEKLKQNFSIKRYACCADWTAEEWLQALSARSLFRLKIHSAKDKAATEAMASAVFARMPDLREILLKEAEARLADPLMDLARAQPIPHVPRSLAVRDFVASDLYFVNKSLQGLDWEVCQDVVVRSFAWSDPASEPIFAAVNLCHSDQLIIDEFSLWLHKVRARTGVGPTKENETYLTEEVFQAWHERHLLAYLDIAFWARLTETQLGNERIGAALYGPTTDTKKRMEKNAKEALRLISKHNLEALTKLVMRRRAMA